MKFNIGVVKMMYTTVEVDSDNFEEAENSVIESVRNENNVSDSYDWITTVETFDPDYE